MICCKRTISIAIFLGFSVMFACKPAATSKGKDVIATIPAGSLQAALGCTSIVTKDGATFANPSAYLVNQGQCAISMAGVSAQDKFLPDSIGWTMLARGVSTHPVQYSGTGWDPTTSFLQYASDGNIYFYPNNTLNGSDGTQTAAIATGSPANGAAQFASISMGSCGVLFTNVTTEPSGGCSYTSNTQDTVSYSATGSAAASSPAPTLPAPNTAGGSCTRTIVRSSLYGSSSNSCNPGLVCNESNICQ